MNSLTELSPMLVPLAALLIPIVWIISWVVLKITRLHLLHETIRHLSVSGQPIPPELLHQIIDRK